MRRDNTNRLSGSVRCRGNLIDPPSSPSQSPRRRIWGRELSIARRTEFGERALFLLRCRKLDTTIPAGSRCPGPLSGRGETVSLYSSQLCPGSQGGFPSRSAHRGHGAKPYPYSRKAALASSSFGADPCPSAIIRQMNEMFALAERHVIAGRKIVARQRELVRRLEVSGRDAAFARKAPHGWPAGLCSTRTTAPPLVPGVREPVPAMWRPRHRPGHGRPHLADPNARPPVRKQRRFHPTPRHTQAACWTSCQLPCCATVNCAARV